jgi:GntR family transcriptional regulator
MAVVSPLDHEYLSVPTDDSTGHAHRVGRSFVVHPWESRHLEELRCAVVTEYSGRRGSDAPLFRQIAAALRERILDGDLGTGDRLPSETELMAQYGVARMTVRNALAELRAEGLVIAEHGRGVFVRPRPPVRRLASDRFARRHRQAGLGAFLAETQDIGVAEVDQFQLAREVPTTRVRGLLKLTGSAKVVARRRRYLLDSEPVELADSYVPLQLATGTAILERDYGPGGIYARLEETGHMLAEFREEVSARMPTPVERQRLQLPTGTPVILLTRVAFDTSGLPVEMTDTVKAAHRYVLEYRIPAE